MTKRMEWLDALRGFTMILVVAYHVGQMCFGMNLKTSTSMPFVVLFRMPLFFFVSGFLVYKVGRQWSLGQLGTLVWKKFRIQVFPTLVFLCVFLIVRTPDFWEGLQKAMCSATKYGYWFTWALLIMFLVYYVAEYVIAAFSSTSLARRLKCACPWLTANTVIVALWLLSLAAYETAYMPTFFSYPKSEFMRYSSLIQVVYYLHFFLFGNIVRRYWDRFQRLMDSKWFFPLLMVVAFVCCADTLKWHTLRMMWANLPRTVAMYSMMMVFVMFFRANEHAFSHETRLGRTLQYIGVRTLDVYLLHFILMPRLRMVGPWLDAHHPNFLLEQVATLSVAMVVVAFCCFVSAVLRTSPILKKHLFGRK